MRCGDWFNVAIFMYIFYSFVYVTARAKVPSPSLRCNDDRRPAGLARKRRDRRDLREKRHTLAYLLDDRIA